MSGTKLTKSRSIRFPVVFAAVAEIVVDEDLGRKDSISGVRDTLKEMLRFLNP